MESESNTSTDNSNEYDNQCRLLLSTSNYDDLEESIYLLLSDILTENPLIYSKSDFHNIIEDDILNYFTENFVDSGVIENIYDYNKLQHLIKNMVYSFFVNHSNNFPLRSQYEINVASIMKPSYIEEQLRYLKELPQPKQKTPEWYEMRHNLITASSINKIFTSQSQRNSLIYEKCKPYDTNDNSQKNNWHATNSLQWGNLYEPISIMVYEDMNNTIVSDFGCIIHNKYKYIGASPDGINTDPNCCLYGRMVEVKNIVNRDITGIPKDDYWVQMQIQMETCNLEECDFIETRFKEYDTPEDFFNDTTTKQRGIILCFIENNIPNSPPTYVYSKINMDVSKQSVDNWIETEIISHSDKFDLYQKRFWFLDEYSCVLVQRNHLWFNAAIPLIKETWDTILKERKDGYEHRASKKRSIGQCVFVSNDDNVTTTRTIHNINSNNCVSVVKL
jgi:putative phage-type endonuclease